MKVKRNSDDSQMCMVDLLKSAVTSQTNNSYRVVDAGGSDCRWRNGLSYWLSFFCSFNAPRVEGGAQ